MSDLDNSLADVLKERYSIEREIGAGGMATVYRAHDLRHDRHVAIKVVHPELSAVLGGERFLAEIKTTASLQHPHILPLFDSGSANGLLYYVMPFVDGRAQRPAENLTVVRHMPHSTAMTAQEERMANKKDRGARAGGAAETPGRGPSSQPVEEGLEGSVFNDDPASGSGDRSGSEDTTRQRTHESGYGGKVGEPKTSSDQREPRNPR